DGGVLDYFAKAALAGRRARHIVSGHQNLVIHLGDATDSLGDLTGEFLVDLLTYRTAEGGGSFVHNDLDIVSFQIGTQSIAGPDLRLLAGFGHLGGGIGSHRRADARRQSDGRREGKSAGVLLQVHGASPIDQWYRIRDREMAATVETLPLGADQQPRMAKKLVTLRRASSRLRS